MTAVQELFIQLFDKDESTDDFLGQASVELRECIAGAEPAAVCCHFVIFFMLGCLLAAPNHTQTLSLLIPGILLCSLAYLSFCAQCLKITFQT
jgi:hypothetical protein